MKFSFITIVVFFDILDSEFQDSCSNIILINEKSENMTNAIEILFI